jgi:NtrC-family two-component system sensor histidine kinase KinB
MSILRKFLPDPPQNNENKITRASLELMYNISRELASALDLRTVLNRVLFLSMKNVGASSGSIIVMDSNGQPIESALAIGEHIQEQTTQQLRVTFERGLAGWVFRHNQAVLIPDTSRDERWLRRPDDEIERTGPKSAVSAPIASRDQLIGVMTLVHPKTGTFTQDHLALVQAIADQAGIAVLNARLYAESQRQARVMTALAESAATITATLKVDDVLLRILEQISQALRVAVVSLALMDPSGTELVFRASTGPKNQEIVGLRLPIGQGVAGWVAREGRGIIVPDTSKDSRFYPGVDQLLGFETRAIACAPIRSRGQIIGVLEALNPLEGTFDSDALLVLTGIGSLAGTAIRHAQLFERLQAAHQRYRELFEDSIDSILITDWDGHILEANRQAALLIGVHTDNLLKMTIDHLNFVDKNTVGPGYTNLSMGETLSYEATLQTHLGSQVPVQVYAREVNIEGVPHLQWILRDITARKVLDNMRNDLQSMIYHDLRSPLANVVSSLDVLETLMADDPDPTKKSLLNIAARSTERIQRLTNNLLDMRRMEADQPISNLVGAAVAEIVTEAIEAVSVTADNKKQQVINQVSLELPEIQVDVDMIRRVIINLLENALKYTPADSTITIGAEAQGEKVYISVLDNGPGIPDEDQERIFEKFTRLHPNEGPKGLGLGLAFCRLAIEKHGGKIWVESPDEGGACFKFTLPTAQKADEATISQS